ncbi:MAG: hypothetical protein AAF628_17715 [Planctomycetota bacterium]
MRTLIQTTLFCGLVAALAPPIGAQAVQGPFTNSVAFRGAKFFAGSEIIGRMIGGDFTGDGMRDGMVRLDDRAMLAYGPAIHEGLAFVASGCLDLDVLPTTTPGTPDAAILVRPNAIERWVLGPGNTFAGVPIDPAHGGAQRIHVYDLDGSGGPEVIGLAADGRSFFAIADPGGAPLVLPLFQHPTPVHEFLPLRWSPGGGVQIAALTDLGIEILRLDGVALQSPVPEGRDGDVLMRLPVLPAAFDRLVVVQAPTGSGPRTLFVADYTGLEAGLSLGNTHVVSGAAADIDRDGDADIALASKTNQDLLGLLNHGAPPTFTLGAGAFDIDIFEPNRPADLNETNPVAGDWDDDGDHDLFYGIQATYEFGFARSALLDHDAKTARLTGGHYELADNQSEGDLTLNFAMDGVPSWANQLEVVVWREGDPNDPANAHIATTAVMADWPTIPAAAWMTVQLHLVEPIGSAAVYHIVTRPVRHDGVRVAEHGVASLWSFTTNTLSMAALEAGAPGARPINITLGNYNPPQTGPLPAGQPGATLAASKSGEVTSGVVPPPDLPCFLDECVPDPYGDG